MSKRNFEAWDDPSRAFVRMSRYNPPGLQALTYRGAPYHEALARMLASLPGQSSLNKPAVAPLGQLNVADREDWTVALLQAWAAVTDVLTFYQERVTNEGYLCTALEDRSVLELTRAIGYAIPPGISAGTYLAFTVTKRPDQPHQVAVLPAGLAVQSTATPGRLTQVFETGEPFEARSEWNALEPTRYHDVRWRRDIQEDTTKLRFQGIQTGLSIGDRLVVVSQPWLYQLTSISAENEMVVKWRDEYLNPIERKLAKVNQNNLKRADTKWILLFEEKKFKPDVSAILVKLTTVNPVPATGTTVISWDDPIEGPVMVELGGSQWGLVIDDQLLVVGNAHSHLGPDAPQLVGSVSVVQSEPGFDRTTVYLEQNPRHKRGQRVISNPRVLALRQKAALFSYTSSGLFANTEGENDWQPEGIGLPDAAVRDILRYPSGPWYAATTKGLFRSVDEGATWQALSIGLVPRDVYSLALSKQDHLLAGTDKGGIFLSKDRGDTWQALSGESVEPYARGLRKWFPQFFALESLPKVAVRDLITYPSRRIVSATTDVGLTRGIISWLLGGAKNYVIAAATDVGVFRSTNGGRSWRSANHALPNCDKKTGMSDTVVSALATAKGKQLFAATSAGVYHILNRPRSSPGTTIRNILIFAVAFYLFNRQLLSALSSAKGPLYGLINWLSGSGGPIGQLVDWYISELITLTTTTKAILVLGTLALLSLLAAIGYWNQYLNACERTGIVAHTLLAVETDGNLEKGDRLYAGTQAGVFQAESGSKLLQMLGRPVSAWQPINLPSPLFELDAKLATALNNGQVDKLRPLFKRHGHPLPEEAVIREMSLKQQVGQPPPDESNGQVRQWHIGEKYVIRRESAYLQLWTPAVKKEEPVGRLPFSLQAELTARQVPKALQDALKEFELDVSEEAIVETVETQENGVHWLIRKSESDKRMVVKITQEKSALLVYRSVPPRFLIENTYKKCDDLDEGKITDELRVDFARHLFVLPDGALIEAVKRGECWHVRGEDRQVIVTVRCLDEAYLLVFQGLLTPLGTLPQKLQIALDKADITDEMRTEFDKQEIKPQNSQHLFIAFPGLQWYLLNQSDVPIYEIWRIGVRLIVMKAQVVHALGRDNSNNILAGTTNGELHRCLEGLWRRTDAGLAVTDINRIKSIGDTQYVAGTPPEGSTESGWGSSHLRKRFVDLDRVYPALRSGSLFILNQSEPWRQAVYQVRRVDVVDSADILKSGQFTRVELESGERLDEFDRNLTSVWGQSQPLALHDDRPLSGRTLILDHPVPGLAKGKCLIVSGKPMRARMVARKPAHLKVLAPSATATINHRNVLQILKVDPCPEKPVKRSCRLENANRFVGTIVVRKPALLEALATSATASINNREILRILKVDPCPEKSEKRTWRLENANRFVGTIVAGFDEIVLEPAADDDSFVNELVELTDIEVDANQTKLRIKNPLGTYYDRSTVTVLGNVVPATHGQTIADEVLGSSQGAVSYEHFRLRQQPLTYLPGALSGEAVSTLQVYVNDVEWRPEPFFSAELEPDSRAYVLHGDERGGSTLIFGNGLNGARLPANTEKISVTYRIGSGPEGNVPADNLTNLRTRVANLQGVTNPLPACGGVGREPKGQTRQNAPRHVRASQRIVSLTDYQDFTAAYPGIGKSHAELVMRGNQPVICITIADRHGQPMETGSMLFHNLRQAIDAQRAQPIPPVEIQAFSLAYFKVKATLFIHRDHWKRAEGIEKTARERLATAFSFERRDIGQVITAAELIAVLHAADPAITGVEVTSLTREVGDVKDEVIDPLELQEKGLLIINAEGDGGIVLTLRLEDAV